jgi:hypothetical protein
VIRRDYILRMIEDFIAALRRLQTHKEHQSWGEAASGVDEQLQQLIGVNLQTVQQMSETEILAKLMQGEATLYVHDKTFMLTALLREAGDQAVANDRVEEGRAHYVKALHLLLGVLGRQGNERAPEFVPTVETFVSALEDGGVPTRTRAMLMQHYESTGQFARAEDALHVLLDEEPEAVDFGLAFYERLKNQTDTALAIGNLPREEVESGAAELRGRKAQST